MEATIRTQHRRSRDAQGGYTPGFAGSWTAYDAHHGRKKSQAFIWQSGELLKRKFENEREK